MSYMKEKAIEQQNHENQVKFKSIITFLKANKDYPFTARRISDFISLATFEIEPRMEGLIEEGKVKIVKAVSERGKKVNQYQYEDKKAL